MTDARRVAIVGGGLAGLAAAIALTERRIPVTLFEARRQLGGRAGSFRDPATGELIDHCQHVGLGCCTAWRDLFRRTGLDHLLREESILHFVLPGEGSCHFSASSWLPAPLHLAASFLRYPGLSLSELWSIGRNLDRLAALRIPDDADQPTIGTWLTAQGESANAQRRFWGVVITSALSESLERASFTAARKVFVDGFMASADGYRMVVPNVPLATLYEELANWLRTRGATVRLGCPVRQIEGTDERATQLALAGEESAGADAFLLAAPWHQAAGLLSQSLRAAVPQVSLAEQLSSAPITAVHLWWDRPLSAERHAVVIDRLTQWVFRRDSASSESNEHYYQAVISDSGFLAGRPREEIVAEVVRDIGEIWPAAREAELVRSRVVTQQDAVFSPLPGSIQLRPEQATAIPNLFLAGDWTITGWPATMESAVRSGYLAASALLRSFGEEAFEIPEAAPAWIARWRGWKE